MKTSVQNLKNQSIISFISFVSICFLLFFVSSCEKTGVSAGKKVSVILSDAAGDFQQVNVDIQKVEVKVDLDDDINDDNESGDSQDDDNEADVDGDDNLTSKDAYGEWKTIDFTPAVVDLLTLQNGVETILGTTQTTTEVRKVRITLGTNNTVVDNNGVSHPLVLSNSTNNYLYIRIHDEDKDEDAVTNTQQIRIDFDVANSIYMNNGQYYLKPNLRPYSLEHYGEVEGKVFPSNISATVTIEDGQGFTASTQVESDGEFKFRGLDVNATYKLTFEAAGYVSQTKEGIKVTIENELKIPDVTLIK